MRKFRRDISLVLLVAERMNEEKSSATRKNSNCKNIKGQ